MPETKDEEVRVEEDILEGAEDLEPEVGEDELGAAIGEDTGETEITEEEAEAGVAGEEGKQKIAIEYSEAPQFEGMNPGDEIELITTYKVIRKTDTGVEVETIDFMPLEEMEEPPEAGMPPTPPAPTAPPAPPGGGLAGLV